MTGNAVRGARGFVAKEGASFDTRLNVSFHSDELALMDEFRREGETRPDVVRAAFREYVLQHTHEENR